MQFRKLDFWLWAAVIVIVVGATTVLLAVRWEPDIRQRPTAGEQSRNQPKSATTGLF